MQLRRLLLSSLNLASLAVAQFPQAPDDIIIKEIESYPGVSISYKQTSICETSAKAWSGYVHMPISYLSDIETAEPYNISMFFWYFQARNDPENAPTGIYLAGGPGESSMYGVALDGGPCYVNEDSNSTSENPWSMNNYVNMLYVDQPVTAGYSYNELVKSTLDLLTGEIKSFDEWGDKIPEASTTFNYGILPSQNLLQTANTTGVAAVTLWHFAQVWFSDFPEHATCNELVSIWGNSWGGYWVTASGAYIEKQNVKIKSGDIDGTVIELDNIGFTNGCVDMLYQAEWYPHLAYSNVYDLQVINQSLYETALDAYQQKCLPLLLECRELGEIYDPNEFGINKTVNKVCFEASAICTKEVSGVYDIGSSGLRSDYDMAHLNPDPFPRSYPSGFFNQDWVQKELGAAVNFTTNSAVTVIDLVYPKGTGDSYRRAGMKDVEYLLDSGIKVTLMYGDRDYRCPWLGAEKLSLAANWTGSKDFRAAGYANIQTNDSYNGGVVRQHGNLSFSRVFQAGHDAYVYQPETIFQIFNRSMFNKDVATGKVPTSGIFNSYSTIGPESSEGIKLELPPPPPVSCYLYSVSSTCTVDQFAALQNGTAEIVDFTIVKPAGGGGPIPSTGL